VDGDIERVPEHLSPATLKSAAEKRERRTRYPPTTKKAVFEAPICLGSDALGTDGLSAISNSCL
jgi:hypothetical protein